MRTDDDSKYYWLSTDGPPFQSAVFIDGWSAKSIWGRDDGRFFLTLWRDETAHDAAPDLWVSVADRYPLHSPGCVVLALVTRLGVDPVTASVGVQMLCPPPRTDPGPAIHQAAMTELEAVRSAGAPGTDDFALGQYAAYSWAVGSAPDSPAVGQRYPCAVPGYREIVAERNAAAGLVYQLTGHEAQPFYAGVDDALTLLAHHIR